MDFIPWRSLIFVNWKQLEDIKIIPFKSLFVANEMILSITVSYHGLDHCSLNKIINKTCRHNLLQAMTGFSHTLLKPSCKQYFIFEENCYFASWNAIKTNKQTKPKPFSWQATNAKKKRLNKILSFLSFIYILERSPQHLINLTLKKTIYVVFDRLQKKSPKNLKIKRYKRKYDNFHSLSVNCTFTTQYLKKTYWSFLTPKAS